MVKKIRGKWDPYLRRMKEMVGSTRMSHSATEKTTSFSSTSHRPSQSAASQRTVQSQISLDNTSSTRRLSANSLSPVAGVQVHNQNKIAMNTIAESSIPEVEYEQGHNAASFPLPEVKETEQQRLSSSSGTSTADETSHMISHNPNGPQSATEDSLKDTQKQPYKKDNTEIPFTNSMEGNKIPAVNEQIQNTGYEEPIKYAKQQEPGSFTQPNNGVQVPMDETVQSIGEEALSTTSNEDSSPQVTCFLPSRGNNEEPITINGEIPQLVDKTLSQPVSEATIVRVNDEGPPPVEHSRQADVNSFQHSNETGKDESDSKISTDGRQSLSLYDYNDEQPVDV